MPRSDSRQARERHTSRTRAPRPAGLSGELASERSQDATSIPDVAALERRAYEKFVARGREHGHDLEDWYAAERELRGERPPQ